MSTTRSRKTITEKTDTTPNAKGQPQPKPAPATNYSPREYSSQVVDGPDRAASRAMLHALGFTAKDFKKPQVGIASTWNMVTPCNMHIDKLAWAAATGADGAGGKGVIFGVAGISDGISMGTEGMKASMASSPSAVATKICLVVLSRWRA